MAALCISIHEFPAQAPATIFPEQGAYCFWYRGFANLLASVALSWYRPPGIVPTRECFKPIVTTPSQPHVPFQAFALCAFLGALPTVSWCETVIRILHIQSNPKIRAIWRERPQQYESAHPGVRVQLDLAGVTPIAVGGKDKCALHFYPRFS